MTRLLKIIFLIFLLQNTVQAQNTKPPFWDDIQPFKKEASISFPGVNKIFFVGSSSFANWKDVQNYFPGYQIIYRGFGSTSLPGLLRYQYDINNQFQHKQKLIKPYLQK